MAMLSFLATRQRVSRRNAKAVDDASFLPRHELPTLAARDGSLTIPAALRRLGWNHRILTYDDFLLAVAEEAAELVVQPFPDILGETQYLRGNRKRIILDNAMPKTLRLMVAFHEYGHALLHIHRAKDFNLEQCETEADLVGMCALIPQWLVTTYSAAQLAARLPYPRRFCELRIQAYQRYDL